MNDLTEQFQEVVRNASAEGAPLELKGSGSKDFYGREASGSPLMLGDHQGIVNYEPKELVLTARCGTSLAELEILLAEQGQMLAFEPPHFGENATLGGSIACGFSGPRRPYAGSARDFVLGVRIINGRGEVLRFGGEVMKNVAGYDVSRLMTGSLGTLGLILDVSLKVLPQPEDEITLAQERSPEEAIRFMNELAARPLPLSAACYDGVHLYLRLSGAPKALAAAHKLIGGDIQTEGAAFWQDLREQQHGFFSSELPLWRLSIPSHASHLSLPGKQFIDWGGAQRWLISDADAGTIRQAASKAGGHATLFRGGDHGSEVFHPLPETLFALHRRLKSSFDPEGIFNPGRMYENL